MKEYFDNSGNSLNVDLYNNKLYSDLSNDDRLLLGDLIKDNANIHIKYGTNVNNLVFDGSNVEGVYDFSSNLYLASNVIICAGAIRHQQYLTKQH